MTYSDVKLINNNKGKGVDFEIDFILEESIKRKIIYFLDILLFTLCFFFFSLGGSAFINSFICQKLDKSKSELYIFYETTIESIAIVFLIYGLLFYVPKIPSIVPFPNINHLRFRVLCRHAVVGASVIFAHERLFQKYQYFLGIDQ